MLFLSKKSLLVAVSAFLFCCAMTAQHTSETTDHSSHDHQGAVEHHSEHGKHKIAVYVGFTHVPAAYYEHETHEESIGKWVPTIGAEYYRTLNSKFDVGFIGDVELDSYLIPYADEVSVENTEEEVEGGLTRTNVVVLAAVLRYKPIEHLGIFFGPGFETEFTEHSGPLTFWVAKFGVDYEVEISKGWELTPTFSFDLKEHYSSCAFGMSLGKRF